MKTMKRIMNHWTAEIPEDFGYVDLPFNIEEFCRENDDLISKLKKRNEFLEECFNCSNIDVSEVINKAFNRGIGE